MKEVGRGIRAAVVSGLGGALVTGLMRSTRSELICGQEVEGKYLREGRPAVFVLWHGRLLPGAYHFRHRGMATLISQNRDGDYITRMIESWGFRVVRGSSSRGGTAAGREMVALLRSGVSVALTPDGPRGPRERMKFGPLRLAQKAGVPLIPGSAGASGGRSFGRWDRFLVPAPFARCAVALGEPIIVPGDADDRALRAQAVEVEAELNRLTRLVDEAAGARR